MDMIRVSDDRYLSRDVIAEVICQRHPEDGSDVYTIVTKRGERITITWKYAPFVSKQLDL